MEYTENDQFTGKAPNVRAIYDRLIEEINQFGRLRIEPKKTSIHLCNRFGFAGIHTRKTYLHLEIHLNRRLDSHRISKVEQASANRFHHTIPLGDPSEVDSEVVGWLREAWELKA